MENEKVKEIKKYRKRKKRKINVIKLLFAVFIFIILILGIIFITIYNSFDLPFYLLYSFNKDKDISKKDVISGISDNNYHIDVYDDTIIMCSQDGAKGLNKKGEDLWAVSYNTLDPLYNFHDGNIIIFEKQNRKLYYLNNSFRLQELDVKDNVVSANVNSNGYVSVVSQEKGFKGKVTVFNSKGEEIYIWHSSDNYILDSAVSDDGEFFSVSVANDNKGKLTGGIISFRMNSKAPIAALDTGDNIITNINYINTSLAAIGDNQALIINNKGIIEWSYEYNKLQLSDYANNCNLLAIGLDDKDGIGNDKSKIILYNVDTKEYKEYEAEIQINGVDIAQDNILYHSKNHICLINYEGYKVMEKGIDKDIDKALMFDNKRQILVITKNILEIVEY